WVWLLLTMASTVAAISLANVEPLHDAMLPLNCFVAYNNPIFGCVMEDFGSQGCSLTCQGGLARTQYTIQAVCSGVEVSQTSVMGRALSGTLISILC
ncbi:hypothetical protein BT67DRAFT_337434, partial [Trichocladium antarcticum]